jgi:hypothetical protein
MKRTIIAVLLLGLSTSATDPELRLNVHRKTTISLDRAYDVLSPRDQAAFGNYAIGYEVADHFALFAQYTFGTEKNRLFDTMALDFSTNAAQLGVEASYEVESWFRPHARLSLGAFWGDIDLQSDDVVYDQTAVGIAVTLMGGFDLLWKVGGDPNMPSAGFWDHVTLGLSNSYGYQFGPSLTFDELVVEVDEDDDEPAYAEGDPINLGETDLGGYTWRLGISFRYDL